MWKESELKTNVLIKCMKIVKQK